MSKKGDVVYEDGSFLHFYHGEFSDKVLNVVIPDQGLQKFDGASWDRKAAWVMWAERHGIALTYKEAPKPTKRRQDDDDFI